MERTSGNIWCNTLMLTSIEKSTTGSPARLIHVPTRLVRPFVFFVLLSQMIGIAGMLVQELVNPTNILDFLS